MNMKFEDNRNNQVVCGIRLSDRAPAKIPKNKTVCKRNIKCRHCVRCLFKRQRQTQEKLAKEKSKFFNIN